MKEREGVRKGERGVCYLTPLSVAKVMHCRWWLSEVLSME